MTAPDVERDAARYQFIKDHCEIIDPITGAVFEDEAQLDGAMDAMNALKLAGNRSAGAPR